MSLADFMAELLDEGGWRARANCRGRAPIDGASEAHLFFGGRGDHDLRKAAKAVCAPCPVRRPCLEEALDDVERHGVWGGLTEQERKRLRVQRRKGVA